MLFHPHLQLGDVLLLPVGVVGVHPVQLQGRPRRAAARRRDPRQQDAAVLLQVVIGPTVIEAGVLPAGRASS